MKLLVHNIPESLRDEKQGLLQCLEAFAGVRPVERMVLFGSYARGDAQPDSDVDLCIVAEGAEDQWATAREFRRAIRSVRPKPALTLIPISPARLKEKEEQGDFFFETINREGICVAEKD